MPTPVIAMPAIFPPAAGRAPMRIPSRHGVSALPVRGWVAVAVGLPFLASGAYMAIRLLADLVAAGRGAAFGVAHVGVSLAALFAFAGAAAAGAGMRDVLREGTHVRRRRRYPEQPWMWDFAWETEGGRDRAGDDIGRASTTAVFLCLFAVPFTWVGWSAPDGGHVVFRIASAFLVAGALAAVGWAAYVAARTLRFGTSRVRFAEFPVPLGETVTIGLDAVSPAARVLPMMATLRCVQERIETRRRTNERTTELVCYELWSADASLPPGAAEVRFALPAGLPDTVLSARPARFWELELRAAAPGVDFVGRFLVPVYAAVRPVR